MMEDIYSNNNSIHENLPFINTDYSLYSQSTGRIGSIPKSGVSPIVLPYPVATKSQFTPKRSQFNPSPLQSPYHQYQNTGGINMNSNYYDSYNNTNEFIVTDDSNNGRASVTVEPKNYDMDYINYSKKME